MPALVRRSMYALLLLLICAPLAHGQSQSSGGNPGLDAALHVPLLPGRITPSPYLIDPGQAFGIRLPGEAAEARRSRTAYYVAGGAAIGAALGLALVFAPRDCRSGESMCGLAIPLYAGAGAAGGGLIGYVIGSSRR